MASHDHTHSHGNDHHHHHHHDHDHHTHEGEEGKGSSWVGKDGKMYHSHDGLAPHSHVPIYSPGFFSRRAPLLPNRNFKERAFTIGIGGPDGTGDLSFNRDLIGPLSLELGQLSKLNILLGFARAVNCRYISDCVPLRLRMQASAGLVSASALGMVCGPAIAGLLQMDFKIYITSATESGQSNEPEKGIKKPLISSISEKQENDADDMEEDNTEEAPLQSQKAATSIASAYRLLTPSVKAKFYSCHRSWCHLCQLILTRTLEWTLNWCILHSMF